MSNETETTEIVNEEVHEEVVADHSETEATKTHEEVSHEVTLFAEPVFHVGNFPVTNSLINSWVTVFIIVLFALALKRRIKRIPEGIQNAFEIIVEGALNLADSVTGDRKKSQKVFPIVFAIFIFVLINNWLGLVPGIGSVGFIEEGGGHSVFIPFFRGGTADLNTTLALALFAVIGSNVFGVVIVGAWKYMNKFINIEAIAEIPKKIRKDPAIIFVNPIKAFVGIIEIIGEFAKIASLSFRLFGNVFAGEVLLSSMAVIFAFVLPVPFMFLEVIVGIIQAIIFAMLTLVYFTIASTEEEH
ncbi:F0F1 ATP synthase subunit A [Patescibacteria group bacterium]|nr:F0F1 ATP synthase subunit A [Patescibacteria group bacterium]